MEYDRFMVLFSNFIDDKVQNAASYYHHMERLVKYLLKRSIIYKGSIILYSSDGCGKWYRCARALYFISMLSSAYAIVIGWAISSPGHVKGIINRINAATKAFLKRCILSILTSDASTEDVYADKKITPHTVDNGATVIVAEVFTELCDA